MIRRLNGYFDRHPIQAIIFGFAVVVAIILAVVPNDDAKIEAVLHRSTT